MNDCKYFERVLKCLGYEKADIPNDNDTRLRIRGLRHSIGLDDKVNFLMFRLDGSLVAYRLPKQK